MKRLVVIVSPAILLVELLLFGLSDTVISTIDASVPSNEVTSSVAEDNNVSATATITITMRTAPLSDK